MNSERELSLAVVGIDYANADGGNRRFECQLCLPGETVELRPEPKNKHDEYAVAVFSNRGHQLGYLTAERAPWIGGKIRSGEPAEAVFQELLPTAAVVRVRFGGGMPSLPARASTGDIEPDFYPDEPAPDWGA